jgi:hypothetical protein
MELALRLLALIDIETKAPAATSPEEIIKIETNTSIKAEPLVLTILPLICFSLLIGF